MSVSNESLRAAYHDWMGSALLQEYYEGSDFFNVGYWDPGTTSQARACRRLVDKLLEPLPGEDRFDRVLDVACGRGATTRYLAECLPSAWLIGIDSHSWPE